MKLDIPDIKMPIHEVGAVLHHKHSGRTTTVLGYYNLIEVECDSRVGSKITRHVLTKYICDDGDGVDHFYSPSEVEKPHV